MQTLVYPKTTLVMLAIAFVGAALVTSSPKAHQPTEEANLTAGRWFAGQLHDDRFSAPARRTEAMNRCIAPYMDDNSVNWIRAQNCYLDLMRRM